MSAGRVLFSSKFVAIAACLIFIGSLTTYYYVAESGFNPVPQQTTLSGAAICPADKQDCPGFSLGSMTLRSLNRTDIDSQQVAFAVTPKEASPMARIEVFIDNVSLGAVEGPFAPRVPRLVSLGVPTTISVTPGVIYSVVVEGIFNDSSGAAFAEYWQSTAVVAVGG